MGDAGALGSVNKLHIRLFTICLERFETLLEMHSIRLCSSFSLDMGLEDNIAEPLRAPFVSSSSS